MSPRRTDSRLVLGGVPRAELLPPEIELEKRGRAQRRGLLAVLTLIVVLVGVVYGTVAVVAAASQAALDAANAHAADLLAQQGQYIEVRQLQAQVDAAKEARRIGTSTEIDWVKFMFDLSAASPVDVNIQSWVVTSGSPLAPFGETTVPLEQPRVAEVIITGDTVAFASIATWLDSVKQMPGYADASITEVTTKGDVFEFTATLHINQDAYTNRFATQGSEK
jgi:hypothetical protein